jgi:hypothetical protein
MSTTHQLQAVFWLGLAAFLSWDFMVSQRTAADRGGFRPGHQWRALFDGEVNPHV